MNIHRTPTLAIVFGLVSWSRAAAGDDLPPGVQPLELTGDIASQLVEGADRFLLRKIEESVDKRAGRWRRDFASREAYQRSVEPNRERLARIIGARDPRVPFESPELAGTIGRPALVGRGAGYQVFTVRWPAFGDVHGEGLLLEPIGTPPRARVVALPDAGQTPEDLAGFTDRLPAGSQIARRLAESGCRVVVPALLARSVTHRKLTDREFIYRAAFELGRHPIGYEVQKTLAAVDWLARGAGAGGGGGAGAGGRVGVAGWGEGALIALYSAALDPRVEAALVSGYFGGRNEVWMEPVDRNVFGLLEEFGDAEIATLVAPRALIIEAARGPELTIPSGTGGAPGRLATPDIAAVRAEIERARRLVEGLPGSWQPHLVASEDGKGPFGTEEALRRLLSVLGAEGLAAAGLALPGGPPEKLTTLPDSTERQRRQMHELDRHNQALLAESPYVRQKFMEKLDTSSVEKYRESSEPYRRQFREEVIGSFADAILPPNPRARRAYDRPGWTGYEVVLDVYPDVIAYGILLLPKGLRDGERRPVVVCQHGLEGRPQDVVTGDHGAYHDFAAKLAERGFITFAPQNLYLFGDRFRSLQRKANPLKKTLFSLIVPQHQQIVSWLKTLPWVDPERIAFYGLSYGGKTAMRVPALVTDYCLSICSADFNEWVWKNASSRSPYSYVWTGEYEIFEFDLGSTFNYAEMAALIAPRPFMVERGHFDGVAPDEAVAYEFAKVRNLYEARLRLPGRCELEFFVGPHTINGKGTFDFLHRHLKWPVP